MLYHRRSRVRVARTTSSRPTPTPSYHEISDTSHRLDQRSVLAGDRGGVRPREDPVLPRRRRTTSSSIVLRRHGAVRRFRRCRHDVREGELRGHLRRGSTSTSLTMWASIAAGGERPERPRGLALVVRARPISRASPEQLEPNAVYEKGNSLLQQVPEHPGPALLPAPDDPAQRVRACNSSCGGSSGWTSSVYRLNAPLTRAGVPRCTDDPARRRPCRLGPTGSRWPRVRSTGSRRC